MDAAVLVYGHRDGRGGRRARGARRGLGTRLGRGPRLSVPARAARCTAPRWTLDSLEPMYVTMDLVSRLVSPYDIDPMGRSPSRDCPRQDVSISRSWRNCTDPSSSSPTTDVRPDAARCHQRRGDAGRPARLGLSADDVPGDRSRRRGIRDGGYSGNPTLTPLIRECKSHDTILVPIDPIERPGVPRSAYDMLNRSTKCRSTRRPEGAQDDGAPAKVADPGDGEGRLWTEMRVHVGRNSVMTELGASSKLNPESPFFSFLRDEGRKAR